MKVLDPLIKIIWNRHVQKISSGFILKIILATVFHVHRLLVNQINSIQSKCGLVKIRMAFSSSWTISQYLLKINLQVEQSVQWDSAMIWRQRIQNCRNLMRCLQNFSKILSLNLSISKKSFEYVFMNTSLKNGFIFFFL